MKEITFNIETTVEIFKDIHSYIIAYPVVGKGGFWSNPFKLLNKYKIVAINRLDGEPTSCSICESKTGIVFSFISNSRLKHRKVDSWFKLCPECMEFYINLNKVMNEETKKLCLSFVKKLKN